MARPQLLSPTLNTLDRALPQGLPVHYLYSTPIGSALYESLVDGDDSESAAIVNRLRGVRARPLTWAAVAAD